jgi:hypothetical protein
VNGSVFDSDNPAVFSQPVRLNALVTSGVPGTVPTGTVTFKEGLTVLGVGELSPSPDQGDNVAKAFFDKLDFTVANHTSLTAEYAGNASFASSTSGTQSLNVGKASTSVNAFSLNSPTVFNQQADFTATVAVLPPATKTPFQQYGTAGSVTYKDVAVAVTNFNGTGDALRFPSSLPVGTNEVGVSFIATAEFNSSFSSFPHVVQKASVQIAVGKVPDPSTAFQDVTLTAYLVPVAPGAGTITGNVTFEALDSVFGTFFLGTVSVSSGTAVLVVPYFDFPIYAWYFGITLTGNVRATYSGSTNFNAGVGTSSQYTVFPF